MSKKASNAPLNSSSANDSSVGRSPSPFALRRESVVLIQGALVGAAHTQTASLAAFFVDSAWALAQQQGEPSTNRAAFYAKAVLLSSSLLFPKLEERTNRPVQEVDFDEESMKWKMPSKKQQWERSQQKHQESQVLAAQWMKEVVPLLSTPEATQWVSRLLGRKMDEAPAACIGAAFTEVLRQQPKKQCLAWARERVKLTNLAMRWEQGIVPTGPGNEALVAELAMSPLAKDWQKACELLNQEWGERAWDHTLDSRQCPRTRSERQEEAAVDRLVLAQILRRRSWVYPWIEQQAMERKALGDVKAAKNAARTLLFAWPLAGFDRVGLLKHSLSAAYWARANQGWSASQVEEQLDMLRLAENTNPQWRAQIDGFEPALPEKGEYWAQKQRLECFQDQATASRILEFAKSHGAFDNDDGFWSVREVLAIDHRDAVNGQDMTRWEHWLRLCTMGAWGWPSSHLRTWSPQGVPNTLVLEQWVDLVSQLQEDQYASHGERLTQSYQDWGLSLADKEKVGNESTQTLSSAADSSVYRVSAVALQKLPTILSAAVAQRLTPGLVEVCAQWCALAWASEKSAPIKVEPAAIQEALCTGVERWCMAEGGERTLAGQERFREGLEVSIRLLVQPIKSHEANVPEGGAAASAALSLKMLSVVNARWANSFARLRTESVPTNGISRKEEAQDLQAMYRFDWVQWGSALVERAQLWSTLTPESYEATPEKAKNQAPRPIRPQRRL